MGSYLLTDRIDNEYFNLHFQECLAVLETQQDQFCLSLLLDQSIQ